MSVKTKSTSPSELERGLYLWTKGKNAFQANRVLAAHKNLTQAAALLESGEVAKTAAVKRTLVELCQTAAYCAGRADYLGKPAEPGKPWYFLSVEWTEKCIAYADEVLADDPTRDERVQQCFRRFNLANECMNVGLFTRTEVIARGLLKLAEELDASCTEDDAGYPFFLLEAPRLIAEAKAAQGDLILARTMLTDLIGKTNPLTLDPYSMDAYVSLCQAYRKLNSALWQFKDL